MNFLKKKIKTVVHGKRNKDDDDEDDFDNYVPAVPPHPSKLNGSLPTEPGTDAVKANALSGENSENLFASFSKSTLGSVATSVFDSAAKSIANLAVSDDQQQQNEDSENKLSLEELKAREEEHKRLEKEKLKQQEESKKNNEDWKFFLSLTAKVDAVTSKTQTVLTKLKDESAVNEISKIEDPCFTDKYDQSAPKVAGGWIAFEEQEFNPSDPIFHQPPEEEPSQPEHIAVDKESTQKIARELIDDFGFVNPAAGITVQGAEFDFSTAQDDADPFDTSYIDIEAIKSGDTVKPATLIHNLDFESEFDPFDTSHVEVSIANQDQIVSSVNNEETEDVK